MRLIPLALLVTTALLQTACDSPATPLSATSDLTNGPAAAVPADRLWLPREAEGGSGGGPVLICAPNVTEKVSIKRGAFRLNRATGRFVQTVTVTNVSSTDIFGDLVTHKDPIHLALSGLPTSIGLFNAAGTTLCYVVGSRYVAVDVGADERLTAGETVNFDLEFVNPLNLPITYTPVLIAGGAAP